MKLTHVSLCSGIGGIDLAAEWAGFTTVAQCEIDEYASKVLKKNFKGVPNLHDIRTVTRVTLFEEIYKAQQNHKTKEVVPNGSMGTAVDGNSSETDGSTVTVLSAGFP